MARRPKKVVQSGMDFQIVLVQLFQSHTLNCSESAAEVMNGASSFATSCFPLAVAAGFGHKLVIRRIDFDFFGVAHYI